jgi:predicted metalloprotease with PDZ domain
VDTTLRHLTGDKKSINDFCLAFHGGPGGKPELKTYTFEDVVATLNTLAPYDWAGFLRARLDGTSTKTPLEAVENSGWKVVYNDEPNEIEENQAAVSKLRDESLTVGMAVGDEGTVIDVRHGSPAYATGIGPGMKIVAVNGQQYSPEALAEAIDAGKSSAAPIQMIVANGAEYQTFSVDYHGGQRYPHLERDASKPDYLSEIIHPLAAWIVK